MAKDVRKVIKETACLLWANSHRDCPLYLHCAGIADDTSTMYGEALKKFPSPISASIMLMFPPKLL